MIQKIIVFWHFFKNFPVVLLNYAIKHNFFKREYGENLVLSIKVYFVIFELDPSRIRASQIHIVVIFWLIIVAQRHFFLSKSARYQPQNKSVIDLITLNFSKNAQSFRDICC